MNKILRLQRSAFLIALLLWTSTLAGQSPARTDVVRGAILSAADDSPVSGAEILLIVGGNTRITLSNEQGEFSFGAVTGGQHVLQIRRLGYQPQSLMVDVSGETIFVTARLIATSHGLQRVQVRGSFSGVRGVVGMDSTLSPIPEAQVVVLGTGGRAKTDSLGQFLIGARPGTYLVKVSAQGFRPSMRSVLIRRDSVSEIVELLTSGRMINSHSLEAALLDAYTRLNARGPMSVVVSGVELRQDAPGGLLGALLRNRTTAAKGLRLGRSVCVFLNGRPMPDWNLSMLDTDEVEALELYTKASDTFGNLARLWPTGRECGSTGVATAPDPSVTIAWIVIWTRQ